jgi:hypothetical protein
MLPGPFEYPPLPQLSIYVHPVILWALILLSAVALAITFFRFIFSESRDRVNNFLTFFGVAAGIFLLYFVGMNWPQISAWFRNL